MCSSSLPAPSRSAARVLGLPRGRAEAGGKPGGGGRRPDRPGARLVGEPGGARHRRRPDPADARRYRGAAALSQRPRDHLRAAEARRRADHQRERHGRDQRNPLRRQRPAGRPRRHDDRRRPAGAAVRCRRALYGAAERDPDAAAFIASVAAITPEIEAMAGAAGQRIVARRHADQDRGRPIATAAGTAMVDRRRQALHPLAALGAARRATWFAPTGKPGTARARHGSPGNWRAAGIDRNRRRRDPGAARRARACCRQACAASPAVFRAATRSP